VHEASTSCTTIHDQTNLVFLWVPPKQARDTYISVPIQGYRFGPTNLETPKLRLDIVAATPSDAQD
jgi:hypothetical protein